MSANQRAHRNLLTNQQSRCLPFGQHLQQAITSEMITNMNDPDENNVDGINET